MKTLTPLQRKALFMGIRPAAIEVGEDPEVYRKRILKEELGVEHLDEVSRNGGFDKLMSRIWADWGDYERALSYSKGSEVRLVHLIVDAAKKIVAASPDYDGNEYQYVVGTMAQSKMFERLPGTEPAVFMHEMCYGYYKEEQLKSLLVMLNAYLGRIKRRS
ncbi:MAG: hypothetical protein IJC66_08350 [Kiritimatiellae bacterium]|nr:hypothetical protein [Kiritimatiellia bacterium]